MIPPFEEIKKDDVLSTAIPYGHTEAFPCKIAEHSFIFLDDEKTPFLLQIFEQVGDKVPVIEMNLKGMVRDGVCRILDRKTGAAVETLVFENDVNVTQRVQRDEKAKLASALEALLGNMAASTPSPSAAAPTETPQP